MGFWPPLLWLSNKGIDRIEDEDEKEEEEERRFMESPLSFFACVLPMS